MDMSRLFAFSKITVNKDVSLKDWQAYHSFISGEFASPICSHPLCQKNAEDILILSNAPNQELTKENTLNTDDGYDIFVSPVCSSHMNIEDHIFDNTSSVKIKPPIYSKSEIKMYGQSN